VPLSPAFPYESRYVDVLGSRMHYVESGHGQPVLFVHGNPTWSYLWRNVIPHVTDHGRAVAVDLIGMGRSDKPDIPYRFADHHRLLEGFIEALDLRDLTLVLHDWGGGLGLSYARRHPERVRRVAVMEAVLMPVSWSDATVVERWLFRRMRDPHKGDRMNLDKNFFVERLLPFMTRRRLTGEERAAYREPFATRESRRPVAQWPREIPFSGEPADVHDEISANWDWFRSAPVPKLLLHAEPGMILKPRTVADVARRTTALETVLVGKGRHYLQEDVPDAIGEALAAWLRRTATTPPDGTPEGVLR
jgi:haloalkane dehalogenase